MFGSFFSIIIFLASCVNYEKHALRVSRVIAVLAKSACKHAIFLATRVNKECALTHSRACGGRLRHLPYTPQCTSSRSVFCFAGKQFPVK